MPFRSFGLFVALLALCYTPPAFAQSTPPPVSAPAPLDDSPHGGARLAGGISLLASSVLVGAPLAVYLAAEVPDGAAPAIGVAIPSLVALVVGILELRTSVRELQDLRPRPPAARVLWGPGVVTIHF
jgi:hypothetical protein